MSRTASRPASFVSIPVDELPVGTVKIVDVGGKEIGVFNVGGEFYAYLNWCPHQYAPVCLGEIGGTNEPSAPGEFCFSRDGEVLRCPWHAWEFDLKTGETLFTSDKRRLAGYRVERDGDSVVVSLERARPTRSPRTEA